MVDVFGDFKTCPAVLPLEHHIKVIPICTGGKVPINQLKVKVPLYKSLKKEREVYLGSKDD